MRGMYTQLVWLGYSHADPLLVVRLQSSLITAAFAVPLKYGTCVEALMGLAVTDSLWLYLGEKDHQSNPNGEPIGIYFLTPSRCCCCSRERESANAAASSQADPGTLLL